MNLIHANKRFLAAAGVVLFTALTAPAGWVCIKNELKSVVVIHEVPDGAPGKRGKLVRLLPGEVYREYHPRSGERRVQILDSRAKGTVLLEAKLRWPVEDVSLRIHKQGNVIKLEPVGPMRADAAPVVTPPAGRR